jgi:ADP-ribose pyrophosphatase YjhB (NUDIX family)
MTPAPSAGSEGTKKKRRRKRPAHRAPLSPDSPAKSAQAQNNRPTKGAAKSNNKSYAKRVDEVSAGGLVIDQSGKNGLLIGRIDHKDLSGKRILWSLPKGHIEEGETPEQAALREVAEETGIQSVIERSLGVIDFWFMAGGKRIHKTVHHYLFRETGGLLAPQESEVDEVGWFPLAEIVERLAYPDEKKLIARTGASAEAVEQ